MITAVTTVWTSVLTWIVSAFGDLEAIFYADGALTTIGTLAVIGVGIAVCTLVFNYIRDFLRLR